MTVTVANEDGDSSIYFSLNNPNTSDLFVCAFSGLWCWIMFLVCLHRGCCSSSKNLLPKCLLPCHNYRNLALLCVIVLQAIGFAENGWRYCKSEESHILLFPATIISFLTTILTSVFYHFIEKWRSPGYVWVSLWVWVFQVAIGMFTVWQIASSAISLTLVYPSITFTKSIAASFILSLDLYTVILWTYRLRRCQFLEITPGIRDTSSTSSNNNTPAGGNDILLDSGMETGESEAEDSAKFQTTESITYAHPGCALLSRATFYWFLKILILGWRRPLEFTDFGKLPREEESRYQYERFYKCYLEQKIQLNAHTSNPNCKEVGLWRIFRLVYWREMLSGGILKFMGDGVNYIGPMAISAIVTYVSRVQAGEALSDGNIVDGYYYVGWMEVLSNGWVIACLALLASLAQSTFSQASTHLVSMEGIHVKAALQAMIYHKSLQLPSTFTSDKNSTDGDTNPDDDSHDKNAESTHLSGLGANAGHTGSVINLCSEDADNIMTFFMHCHYIWAIPLKILVILVLLWCQLGIAAVIAAVFCIIILTPLQYLLCKRIAAVNKTFLDVSDERLRHTHELVTGIKLVKLHAWEDVFVKRITRVREEELGLLYCDSILRALMTSLTQGSGVVVTLVTFGLYSLLEGVTLDPSGVFSGLALFQQLTVPLFILPIIVSHTIRAKNSEQRLREFLSLPEVEGPKTPKTPPMVPLKVAKKKMAKSNNKCKSSCKVDKKVPRIVRFSQINQATEETRPTSTYSNTSNDSNWSMKRNSSSPIPSLIPHSLQSMKKDNERASGSVENKSSDSEEETTSLQYNNQRKNGTNKESRTGVAVSIQNGCFAWDDKKKLPILENINTSIPSEGLTVVMGGVGSGKTSFLHALLGEMVTIKGQLRWTGEMSVAYVSQYPWLLNATLRDNILFGRRLLNKRYNKVLQACALKPDIEILPSGDLTEIGERGINLSGGQRQRVAIARALYSDARTVVMDSPLSALDRGVASQVWDEGILQLLLAHRRTVIIATHLTHLARHADKVLYLEFGKIKHQGTPKDISASHPHLWKEWSGEIPLSFSPKEQRLEGRTARERWKLLRTVTKIRIQHSSISRKLRREGKVECKEPHYGDSLRRHYSINRHMRHNILLPGDECEYVPPLTPPLSRQKSQMEKKPLFRIKSSAPALGRNGSQTPQKSLPRHAKSLPPQPRPLARMRSSPAVIPPGNMLQRLFSSASLRSTKRATTSTSDKWHLGRVLTSNSLGEDDLQEDLELEEEVPLDEDIENGKLVSEEERERGKISKWNYVTYMRACGLGMCLSYLFCAFVGQGVSVGLDFWLEKWSDQAAKLWNETNNGVEMDSQKLNASELPLSMHSNNSIIPYNPSDDFVSKSMYDYYPVYGILSVISIALSLFTNLLGQVAAKKGRRQIHEDMLNNIVSCSIRFFDVTPAGRLMNRFTTDTAMIDKELARSVTHLLFFVLLVTSAIVVNAIITPAFLVVAIPICFIYYLIQKFFRCSSRELKRLESLSRSPLYSHISESVGGSMVIRAYGDQQRFTDVLLHRLDTHVMAFTLLHAGNRWLGISLDYIGGMIVFFATLASLLWSTFLGDELSPAKVGLAISYTLLVPVYLNWVVRFLADTEMCLNAVERVHQYTSLASEETTSIYHQKRSILRESNQDMNDVSFISYRSTRRNSSSISGSTGLPPGWPLQGKVEFQDVTLTYDSSLEPVLTNLNFIVNPGEKIGLCGRTGSGKSSLILSLYRLVECSRGRILLDGTDIQQVSLPLLRGSISVIPQDTHLFSGTVRFNLDPLEQHSDDRLWEALEVAQLKSLIKTLPNKLDSDVAEGGGNFSAGQRQLFCVARAILRRSSLLILDEATSALDASTEKALHHALKTAFSHATIITIAHGVKSLLGYSRIIVLENGKLIEDGNPRELAQKENGAFAKLLSAAKESSKS